MTHTSILSSLIPKAAVQLDIPMKEADLIQPKEAGSITVLDHRIFAFGAIMEEPDRTSYLWGFVPFAEQLNGRVWALRSCSFRMGNVKNQK